MLLTFLACTRPVGPPLLLVSSEARPRAALTLDGEPLIGLGPFEADGELRLNGADQAPVPDGVLRYVELGPNGTLVADDWELGADVDADAVLVVPEDEASEIWELFRAEPQEDGLLLLEYTDIWEDLLLDGRLPIEEVVPVWFDADIAVASGRSAAPGASTRSTRGRLVGANSLFVEGLVGADPSGETGSDVDRKPTAGRPGFLIQNFDLGVYAREQLEWVGVYGAGDDCLLLDAGGTWKTCSGGLGTVRGVWRVEGASLWLNEEAWPLDREAHTIDLGETYAPVHSQEAR